LRRRLDALHADALSDLEFALTEAVRPHIRDGWVRLQATVRCAFGRK
jgi:hypothetical protein